MTIPDGPERPEVRIPFFILGLALALFLTFWAVVFFA